MNQPVTSVSQRPKDFSEFVGQSHIKSILETAIQSALTTTKPLGHLLFSGSSGFGKTTLATITASMLEARIKIITGYAISKPSELISILNMIDEGDVLFIDEIHRLRAPVEEVLYTAMEDHCVDMVMPDGHHIRLPVSPFTLIGATTKLESLTPALKNRFVYQFHMEPYTQSEKQSIVRRYIDLQQIFCDDTMIVTISDHIASVPRQIANFCHQLKDYLIAHTSDTKGKINKSTHTHALTTDIRTDFRSRTALEKGGITPLHQRYLSILSESETDPVGLRTLSAKLGMSEKAIENDIEPLLFELDRIRKTKRGRVLK